MVMVSLYYKYIVHSSLDNFAFSPGTFSSSNIEYNPGRMSGSSEWSCIQRDAYEYVRSSEFVLKVEPYLHIVLFDLF